MFISCFGLLAGCAHAPTTTFDPSLEGTEFTFGPTLDHDRLEKYPVESLAL